MLSASAVWAADLNDYLIKSTDPYDNMDSETRLADRDILVETCLLENLFRVQMLSLVTLLPLFGLGLQYSSARPRISFDFSNGLNLISLLMPEKRTGTIYTLRCTLLLDLRYIFWDLCFESVSHEGKSNKAR